MVSKMFLQEISSDILCLGYADDCRKIKLQNNFKVLAMVKYCSFFLYKLACGCLLYRAIAELFGGGGGAKIQD